MSSPDSSGTLKSLSRTNIDAPIDTRFKYIFTYEEKDGKIFENRKLDTNEELLDDLKVRRIEQTKKW